MLSFQLLDIQFQPFRWLSHHLKSFMKHINEVTKELQAFTINSWIHGLVCTCCVCIGRGKRVSSLCMFLKDSGLQ